MILTRNGDVSQWGWSVYCAVRTESLRVTQVKLFCT